MRYPSSTELTPRNRTIRDEDGDLVPVGTRGQCLFLLLLLVSSIPAVVGCITIVRWLWSALF